MVVGYALSSEEHGPGVLVGYARRAEEAGFGLLAISDHYHPWIDRQGHSPFVWSVLGAIAEATERVPVGTRVTCPTARIHPAIVAQAAATVTAMLGDRFFLSVGTGENLNEHILGNRWPPVPQRQEMLEEAVGVIRRLWTGKQVTHRGRHYSVENARLYTLPQRPPPIMVAVGGPKAAALAGRIGDGMIGVSPDRDVIDAFEDAGGNGKERYGEIHVCWASDESEARRTALEWWPNSALQGAMGTDLALPTHFEQAAGMVTEDDVAAAVTCGPNPDRHVEAIRAYFDAGYDAVWVHQVGPDQGGFFDFYETEVLPHFHDGARGGKMGLSPPTRGREDLMAEKTRDDQEDLPIDAPEGDAAEQSRSWANDEERPPTPSIPPDAPEADVLDQSRPADLDDEDREHE